MSHSCATGCRHGYCPGITKNTKRVRRGATMANKPRSNKQSKRRASPPTSALRRHVVASLLVAVSLPAALSLCGSRLERSGLLALEQGEPATAVVMLTRARQSAAYSGAALLGRLPGGLLWSGLSPNSEYAAGRALLHILAPRVYRAPLAQGPHF